MIHTSIKIKILPLIFIIIIMMTMMMTMMIVVTRMAVMVTPHFSRDLDISEPIVVSWLESLPSTDEGRVFKAMHTISVFFSLCHHEP